MAEHKTALILEGGAMRGLYSAGVLDIFMKNNINADVVYGVSAGALFGLNYKSRQIGRALRYNLKYANEKNYMGLYSLITTGDIIVIGRFLISRKYQSGECTFDRSYFHIQTFRSSEHVIPIFFCSFNEFRLFFSTWPNGIKPFSMVIAMRYV